MPLFIVTACHSVEACPAGNPEKTQMLFSHVSQANATKYGIYIQASAVAEGKHTLYLILEASDSQKVQVFMNPFDRLGTVEVMPGTTCEAVVARQRC